MDFVVRKYVVVVFCFHNDLLFNLICIIIFLAIDKVCDYLAGIKYRTVEFRWLKDLTF